MGIKVARKKKTPLLLSIIYRFQKLLPLSTSSKFKLFLNLEWIFDRLAHETSFKYYAISDHPIRQQSLRFLMENIDESDLVLDLGSNLGDISFAIALKAKEVVGIDHNSQAIETAKQLYTKSNLTFYNKEASLFLAESSQKFDVLILSHILEHLDYPEDFLLKFKDNFKRIYIEVPDFDRYYLNHYRKDLKLNLIYSDDDHVSEFDREELGQILRNCNIEVVKAEYIFGVQKLWCNVL